MKLIQRNIAQIVALCEKHKVESLYVFGSVLTDRFNDESDIDFVVVFDKANVEDYFDNYFDFKYALEDLFNRSVDLVEDQTIKNTYLRQNVDASKQRIICSPVANKFHTCSLRSIFCQVHAPAENDLDLIFCLRRKLCEAFLTV